MPISNQVSIFVGGVQKSGTRSVSQYFRQHPNLTVHKKNEGHFFDRNENFIDNIPLAAALNDYHNNFTINSDTRALCDITPDYIFRRAAVQRVFNYNPSATWVIFLRNPIDRAYSAWNMEVNRNTEKLSFEDALLSELKGNTKDRLHDRFQYLERSRYYPQILNLWKYFPRSQCHICSAESVWRQPQVTLNKILKSLNVPVNINHEYEHIHKGTYKGNFTEQTRELLINQLHYELTELPDILGWNKNPWTTI